MRLNIFILCVLILSNITTQCRDNVLCDHGIIIKETNKEVEDIKFSMSKKEVQPTLEANVSEPAVSKPNLDNYQTKVNSKLFCIRNLSLESHLFENYFF